MIEIRSIVEGHAEVDSVGILIRRIANTLHPDIAVTTPRPYLAKRNRLLKLGSGELDRAFRLTQAQLGSAGGVLILVDSDGDCPVEIRNLLNSAISSLPGSKNTEVVCAHREFETWFLWAASSLAGTEGLPQALTPPSEPESIQGAKEWLRDRMQRKYIETLHQPRFTAKFDMQQARARSRSFRKLWDSVESLIDRATQDSNLAKLKET